MSDNPTTPETAMPEPDSAQNPAGQSTPAPAWWSRLHSPTNPTHGASATPPGHDSDVPSALPMPRNIAGPTPRTVVEPGGSVTESGPHSFGPGGTEPGEDLPEEQPQPVDEQHRVHSVVDPFGNPAQQEEGSDSASNPGDDLQPAAQGTFHTSDITSTSPAMWPELWTITPAVGAVVTDVGVTFSLAPAALAEHPITVRCTSCDWDITAPQPEAADAIRVHALRHIADPRPRISHLPSWLQPRPKGRR